MSAPTKGFPLHSPHGGSAPPRVEIEYACGYCGRRITVERRVDIYICDGCGSMVLVQFVSETGEAV